MARDRLAYLNTNLLRCRECNSLSDEEFCSKLDAALHGEKNELSKHIRFRLDRPYVPGWARMRRGVIERDNHTCRYCGSTDGPMTCDHVIPLKHGGPTKPDNLVAACLSCNSRKKDRTPEEWLSAGD